MVIEPVPEEVKQARIRQLKHNAKKKGRTPRERNRMWQAWNFHISNVSPQDLPPQAFRLLYSLRWSVELIFKNWKSNFHLGILPNVKKERGLCIIYAKLLLIALTHQIASLSRIIVWNNKQREVSLFRASKLIRTLAFEWMELLWKRLHFDEYLKHIFTLIKFQCLKSKQLSRIYPLEIMEFLQLLAKQQLDQASLDFCSYVNRNYQA